MSLKTLKREKRALCRFSVNHKWEEITIDNPNDKAEPFPKKFHSYYRQLETVKIRCDAAAPSHHSAQSQFG